MVLAHARNLNPANQPTSIKCYSDARAFISPLLSASCLLSSAHILGGCGFKRILRLHKSREEAQDECQKSVSS